MYLMKKNKRAFFRSTCIRLLDLVLVHTQILPQEAKLVRTHSTIPRLKVVSREKAQKEQKTFLTLFKLRQFLYLSKSVKSSLNPLPQRLWRLDLAAFGASLIDAFGVSRLCPPLGKFQHMLSVILWSNDVWNHSECHCMLQTTESTWASLSTAAWTASAKPLPTLHILCKIWT